MAESSPAIRGFQLDSSSIGDAQKSVNLFRGEVNFPLKLVSLPGPNGLDLNLSAFYSGSTPKQVDTWNLEAPTGVLGLGWTLPFDFIEFRHSGTASYLEGQFISHIDGRATELVLISWTERYDPANETLELADPLNPLWVYIYRTRDEVWSVKRDDGVTMTFGGKASHPDAVQWGVRWGNWVSASQSTLETPQQFGVAWNLAEVRNQWGNRLVYSYLTDERTVAGDRKYTRASYVESIEDAYGRQVRFHYDDKKPEEYRPPNTVDGQAPDAAYQDRYETKFLARIDVEAPSSELYYSIAFDSKPLSLGDTPAGDPILTDSSKRYLLQVRQLRSGREVLPPLKLDYDLKRGSFSRGRVTRVTYPAGGSVTWRYRKQLLGDSEIFNLDFIAKRPSEPIFQTAIPRLWFGPDYIVVLWYSRSNSRIKIQIFEYGGRWAHEPHQDTLNGNPESIDDFHIAFGSDFFAFYFHGQGNSTDRLFVYQKTPDQFGNWTRQRFGDIRSGDSHADETGLATGNDFVALHPGGTNALYRFAYDRRRRQWSASNPNPISGPRGETRMALAGHANVLAVGFFTDGDTVSVADQIYWLDTGREAGLAWHEGISSPSSHGSFPWHGVYVSRYMRLGAGFAVGTYLDGNAAKLHVTAWELNFSSFSDLTLDGDAAPDAVPPSTVVSGSTIANQGRHYRYDGRDWSDQQLGWSGKTINALGDSVVGATLDGSGFDTRLDQYDPLEGQSGAWNPSRLSTGASPSKPAGPQFGGRFLTIGANLFFKKTDNEWERLTNALSGSSGTVVACHGPLYVAYQVGNPNSPSTRVALLLNGQVDGEPVTLDGQALGEPSAPGASLTGPTAFATYDNKYGNDFRRVPEFTLHRILNRQVGGFPNDVVVSELDVETGTQCLCTVYRYDTKTALFDAAGDVAQYPYVVAEQQDGSGTSLGSTEFHYFNGLEPTDPKQRVAHCYSLAAGYLVSVTEKDEMSKTVSSAVNYWQGLTYNREFSKLSSIHVVRQYQHDQTLENLDVLDPGSTAPIRLDGQRKLTTTMAYVPETTDIRTKTVTQHGSDGTPQTRVATVKYAWEVYEGMKQPGGDLAPMLSSRAQTTLLLNGQPVQSYVSTYCNQWSGAPAAWGMLQTWRWKGEGTDTDFDFDDPSGQTQWLAIGSVDERSSTGLVKVASNATGIRTVTTYDKTGLWSAGSIVNSDGSDAAFTSFESYEPDGIWTGGITQTGDAHTGNASVHLDSGQSLTSTTLRSASGQDRYLLACFVKSSAAGQIKLSLQVGSSTAATRQVATKTEWQYVFVYADARGADQALKGSITAVGAKVLVDDVQIAPVVSALAATVYDDRLMRPVASVGPNGQTSQAFYDYLLRPLGQSGPDDEMTSYSAQGYAPGGLDVEAGRLNAMISLTADDGGPFDDFRDSDWLQRWTSGRPGNWAVVDKVLTHQGIQEDTVSMKGTANLSNMAVHVQVMQPGTTASGSFGIKIGSRLTARWNSQSGRWELLDASRVIDHAPPVGGRAPAVPTDLLLIAGRHGVAFFVDQQQTLAYAFSSTDPIIQGAVQLFTAADGMGFAQVLVYRSPIPTLTYSDGHQRAVQTQQMADNDLIASQSFYDELGRATVTTKPATYTETVFGYQKDFARAPDPRNEWKMTGYVSDFYSGTDGRSDDQGYPYSRQRLENSTLGRLFESGQPGADLAIRPGNQRTTRYLYGTNTANPFFAATPEEQYEVQVVIDPDGLTDTTVKDQLGNPIASVLGSESNGHRQESSTRLDARDNPRTLRTPNFYALPNGDASDWDQSFHYDVFGRLTESTTNNAQTTQRIYDTLGNLRFELIADGHPDAGDAQPCTNQTAIRYRKYDALSRATERGWICVAEWNETELKAKADQDWPVDPDTWRFRYHYDGDQTQPNAQGELTRVETRQPVGAPVTESFEYNLAGSVIARTTWVPGAFEQTVAYRRNHAGRVTRKVLPSLNGDSDLTLDFSYDARGQVASISHPDQGTIAEYTWDAAGNPASEKLGAGVVQRQFSYTSSGQPRTIEGNRSSETFHYHDGTGTPRYNGLPSAIEFRFADAPTTTWALEWDNYQRITGVTVSNDGSNQTYRYDANGNVTSHNDTTFAFNDGTDQLKSSSGTPGEFHYTPSGKVAASPEWDFGYDFESGLVTAVESPDGNAKLSLTFGSSAQRLIKHWKGRNGELTRQYLPGSGSRSLVERTEMSGSRPTELRYLFGPLGMIAIQSNESDLVYVVRDHEQSIRQVVAPDGETSAAFDYEPFGRISRVAGSDPARFIYRYTGQEWDEETALYNYRHRLYDPLALRFLSTDPAHQYFSPYIYVGNNPLTLTDPTGEFSLGGFSLSLAETAVGALAIPFTGGASVALVGAGIAGIGYSIKTDDKDFSWSKWGQAEAGGAIGAVEIAAGVALTVVTDGTAGSIGGGTLISAGFSGLTYSTFAGNDYNWKDFGTQEAVGAIGGLITGGFGAAGGFVARRLFSGALPYFSEATGAQKFVGSLAIEALFSAAGGALHSAAVQAVDMGIQGKSASEIFSTEGIFSTKSLISDAVSGGLGLAGAGAGKAVGAKLGQSLAGRLASDEDPLLGGAGQPYRSRFAGNIVRTGETTGPITQFTGWMVFEKGVIEKIPKLIPPLAFNSKKWWFRFV